MAETKLKFWIYMYPGGQRTETKYAGCQEIYNTSQELLSEVETSNRKISGVHIGQNALLKFLSGQLPKFKMRRTIF